MDTAARELLLEVMLRELDEKGREAIEIANVLARAGVEEEDFDAEFTDLDDCLFAAYGQLTDRLDRALLQGCEDSVNPPSRPGAQWPEKVRGGLYSLLNALAANAQMARVLILTFPALGPAAQARYQTFLESFGPHLAPGREFSELGLALPNEVEMLAVGAAEAIAFQEIVAGRTEQLPKMAPSILFSLLVPFVGPDSAAAEMERARESA